MLNSFSKITGKWAWKIYAVTPAGFQVKFLLILVLNFIIALFHQQLA
jgi:uncharacterized RDD family membrane protein YckC